MPTIVVNCKTDKCDVYIGRPSAWGNPFKIGRDGTRDEVIAKYEEWIVENHKLMSRIYTLKGKTLGCWCKPSACHGDVLAKLAEGIDEVSSELEE